MIPRALINELVLSQYVDVDVWHIHNIVQCMGYLKGLLSLLRIREPNTALRLCDNM